MVRNHTVKSIAAALLILVGAATPALGRQELALIVSPQSQVDELDAPLARRLFLGLTVADHGVRLRPLLNESDPLMTDVFLQQIVSMSDSNYHRYLLRLVLIQGRAKPTVYKTSHELIDAVASDPATVGYAWVKDVLADPRVRILRIVWHD